jgi:iron complex outermembrane recepter protein
MRFCMSERGSVGIGRCAALVLADGVLVATCALGSPSPQAEQLVVLEEVIVTAQKRVENVQDVPLTVNVVEGMTLDNFTIRDTTDLAASVPGLTIQHTPQNLAQVTVRGLGTGSGGESLEQSVGLFIDGIWAGRIREFQASLFDMERVEVIKGTQTTLLGKNTSLGAVTVVTRKPGDTLGGYIQADYEFEFDSRYVTGAADLPTELGNFRLAFNVVDEGGYVDNKATGNEVPEREQDTLRLSGAWDVGDSGDLVLQYQWDDLEILGDSFQPDEDQLGFMAAMDPNAEIGINQVKTAWTSYGSTGDAHDEQESHRAMAIYQHHFGEYLFTSLTGWSEYDNDRITDADFLSVDYLTTTYRSDFEQISQELRVASPGGGRLEYIAGLYYLDSAMDYVGLTDTSFPWPELPSPLPLDSTNQLSYEQDTEVWSLFGQGTLELGTRWRVTVGLRYTDEKKEAIWGRERLRSGGPLADIIADVLAPEVPPTPLDRSEDNLDGSVNLQFDLNDSVMGFVSWARGSKSGGFSVDVATPEEAEYDTEEAETLELGLKSNFAGGAALVNASLFYTEIEDFQVNSFVGDGFLTETVPARSQGLEFEVQWMAARDLLLAASATYAEAEERDSDLRLPYAPELSASLNARYEYPLSGGELLWRLEGVLNYRDEQYQQRSESALDDELTLLDLRLALASVGGGWELALVGRNLLDDETSFGFDYPFFGGTALAAGTTTLGSLNRPRTLALQLRLSFPGI